MNMLGTRNKLLPTEGPVPRSPAFSPLSWRGDAQSNDGPDDIISANEGHVFPFPLFQSRKKSCADCPLVNRRLPMALGIGDARRCIGLQKSPTAKGSRKSGTCV